MELSNEDRRGLQRAGAATSEYNATMFAVEEVLNSDMNTAWVGVVDQLVVLDGFHRREQMVDSVLVLSFLHSSLMLIAIKSLLRTP